MSRFPVRLLGRHFVTTRTSGRTAITDANSRPSAEPLETPRKDRVLDHAHAVLELPVVLEAIAARARSVPGRARILALGPYERVESARGAQELYGDLLACEADGDSPPPAAPPDLRPELARLALEGATLRGEELWRFGLLLDQVRALVTWHRKTRRETPALDRALSALDPLDPLHREITRTLDAEGEVKDDASPELSKIRRAIRTLRARLASKLESLLRGLSTPESFVTLRDGRYVLAVPSGSRRLVPGTVVGHSGSGASLFVEPRDAAEGNSELAEHALAETREIERILRELTARAHRDEPALERNFVEMARIDAAQAVTAWAGDAQAALPELGEQRVMKIRGGRHPILVERHRKGESAPPVPLDLGLDQDHPMLLVTGPNMGGKTVAMKTVGLLALLAAAGLPIPAAAGTVIPWFDRVICDIGDEQSISSDVSTFLSHLRRVSEALGQATPRSLVLLDELGSGTDPVEGAALGQAVLEALLERRALCVATTHHGMLKTFAHETPGVRNASMAFDETTLRPLFRIVVGVPGGSRAIQVAERFGVDARVLDRARALLPQGERDLNRLLEELGRLREEARDERAALEQTRGQLSEREAELKAALDRLEGERKERKQAELSARRELLNQLESQIDDYRKKMRSEKRTTPATLQEARGLAKGLSEAIEREDSPELSNRSDGDPVTSAAPGDRLFVPTLRAEATALTAPDADGKVRVRIGGATAVLPLSQLRRAPSGKAPAVTRAPAAAEWPEAKTEIDVRGFEADDAIRAVERFLEDAHMGGLEKARIIHGKGTGVLRERMKHWLQTNTLVKEYRLGELGEGGTGVTIVTLT
jgi:DNA mismatch repair protein MutS2